MKKILKDLFIWLLMFTMIFSTVYIITISADVEYEVQQERLNAHFDRAYNN